MTYDGAKNVRRAVRRNVDLFARRGGYIVAAIFGLVHITFGTILRVPTFTFPVFNDPLTITVIFGVGIMAIATIAVHPRYDPQSFALNRATADVALLKLAVALPERIGPAPLGHANASVAVGNPLIIAGFGVTAAGSDITLVTYGGSLGKTLQAAEQLSQQGVAAEVIDLRTLRPLDTNAILASLTRTHRMVIVDEGWKSGSLAAEIMARAMERRCIIPPERSRGS